MNEKPAVPLTVADSEILAGRTISAIKTIHEHLGRSLQEAVLAYHDRWEVLRREQPDAFAEALDDH
ncbi:hypothetical protein ABT144_15690 [Streptomyces sp. NPDC002039]|uniref:hypothetical protein n=1 Tax=Streptomyces sp. NPDC002039 TaxID=3154660 RepID=UPI00333446A2